MKKFTSIIIVVVAMLSGAQYFDLQKFGLDFLEIKNPAIISLLNELRDLALKGTQPSSDRSKPVIADVPGHPGFPVIAGHYEIVEHDYYTLSYNEQYEQPNWVMYRLTKEMLAPSKLKRQDDFRSDPEVDTGSATKKDYVRSGYDRGHLVPAADMKFSKEALSETFYMSNMSPQAPGFNRGMWKDLESQVRNWARNDDDYYIVIGPVFTGDMGAIGPNGVAVPEYYYKIIVDLQEPHQKAIAFLMKNTRLEGELLDYAVPIDSIETLTGIDFFAALPDEFEDWLEGTVEVSEWVVK